MFQSYILNTKVTLHYDKITVIFFDETLISISKKPHELFISTLSVGCRKGTTDVRSSTLYKVLPRPYRFKVPWCQTSGFVSRPCGWPGCYEMFNGVIKVSTFTSLENLVQLSLLTHSATFWKAMFQVQGHSGNVSWPWSHALKNEWLNTVSPESMSEESLHSWNSSLWASLFTSWSDRL